MEKTGVQRLAYILKILVTIAFICNLAALLLVPVLVFLSPKETVTVIAERMTYLTGLGTPSEDYFPLMVFFLAAWHEVWEESHSAILTVFLMTCGVCTALILWQARRVLCTICNQNPFCMDNAVSMRRAAVCCFLISAVALARTCWGFWYYRSIRPLLTYNALFCPVFLLAGLLCMVISTLFRQAAELKADNDLTI